ncbi:MAG TPA: family 10 glycosylhydrolase [Bryobacteraceae bacterium]|nr:family 10 glycosylhydrolase [Bryobacteraceae bacterium]
MLLPMSEFSRRNFMSLVPASAAASRLQAAPAAAGTEARAVWLHLASMFDADPKKGKEQLRACVGRLAETNFNLILPWVTSDYLVALEDAECRQGNANAAWDSLGVLIDESARAGLTVETWYAFTEYRNAKSSDYNPRLGGDPRWAALRITEYRPDPKTGVIAPRKWEDVCPQHPGMRKWQMALLGKMLARYPKLAGIHIEEPGYTYRGNCLCSLCMEVFPKLYGSPLPEAIDTQQAEDFRTIGSSFFMAELLDVMRKNHPRMVFSANGGPNWRNDRKTGRDWGRWARSGWLDYYASQVYATNTDVFRQRLRGTITDLSPECPVYAGIAFRWSGGKNTIEEVVRQIEASREVGAAGVCLFSAGAFTDEFYAALKNGPFRAPAKQPLPKRLATL